MTVTDTVLQHFDATRKIDYSRLEFLRSLNLEPQFMSACEKMFNDCQAGVQEVVDITDTITAANDSVKKGFADLNYKRKAGTYEAFISTAT